jgi:hypothetical protein
LRYQRCALLTLGLEFEVEFSTTRRHQRLKFRAQLIPRCERVSIDSVWGEGYELLAQRA